MLKKVTVASERQVESVSSAPLPFPEIVGAVSRATAASGRARMDRGRWETAQYPRHLRCGGLPRPDRPSWTSLCERRSSRSDTAYFDRRDKTKDHPPTCSPMFPVALLLGSQ